MPEKPVSIIPASCEIQRDAQYWQTLRRDTWRQRGRRWANGLGSAYEKLICYPRWERMGCRKQKLPTLSTCIITMNSAHRIRPLLQYVRGFSDEIVVGVDSKTTDDTLAACQGLADELFVIPNDSLTCNAALETLVGRCHGDWILRLDDDEFPEPAFARFKAGILATDKLTHYKLPRLHLAQVRSPQAQPDMTGPDITWINDGYLYPDYQMRLFRNEPSLLSFPGAVGHLGIRCAGPKGRLNSINLVHLNLAMNPRHKREEKLATYIRRLNGGWVHPINEHALLFEDFHYNIQPYRHTDDAFNRILADTIRVQRQIFEPDFDIRAMSAGLGL